MVSLNAVIIRSKKDVPAEEMEEIAQAIRGLHLDCDVRVDITERTGYGVTWFKVLHIVLEGSIFAATAAAGAAAKKIAEAVIDWASAQFTKSNRPVSVSIYGPDGDVLKSVVVKPDGVQDRTDEDKGRREQFLKLQAEQQKSEKRRWG
jgi:hypothetical protein